MTGWRVHRPFLLDEKSTGPSWLAAGWTWYLNKSARDWTRDWKKDSFAWTVKSTNLFFYGIGDRSTLPLCVPVMMTQKRLLVHWDLWKWIDMIGHKVERTILIGWVDTSNNINHQWHGTQTAVYILFCNSLNTCTINNKIHHYVVQTP